MKEKVDAEFVEKYKICYNSPDLKLVFSTFYLVMFEN
jgi:hypothetical protein